MLEETLETLRRGSGDRRAAAELALTRLSEPRLSTSPEALLARIEELEKQVALLRTGGVAPQTTAKKESPAPVPGKPEKADGAKEEKMPEQPPEKSSDAPAKKEPKKSAESAEPISKWNLILEEFGQVKPAMLPFMRGSSATLSDGVATVSLTVGMFLTLVDGDETAKTVLLSLLSEHGVKANEVRFVSGSQKKNNDGQIEF
ncbi:MAG: hypothetical protein J6P88_04255 [Clostridia bacterium]|nr:hypothetical protein [Clostridia bacterium]